MNHMEKWLPWSIVGVGVLYLVAFMVPPDDPADGFPLEDFKTLPVIESGRPKPLDSLARVNLMVVTGGRQTFTDEDGNSQPAIRWLLDTMSGHLTYVKTMEEGVVNSPLRFTLADPGLRKALLPGQFMMKPRPSNEYTLADMVGTPGNPVAFERLIQDVHRQAAIIRKASPSQWDDADIRFMAFYEKEFEEIRDVYHGLQVKAFLQAPSAKHKVFRIENEEVLGLLGLEARPRFRYALTEFAGRMKEFYEQAHRAQATPKEDRTLYDAKVLEVAHRLQVFGGLVNGTTPLALPVPRSLDWYPLAVAWDPELRDGLPFFGILTAYSEGDVAGFKQSLKKFRSDLDRFHPDLKGATSLETFFNYASPFFHLQHLYMLVFLFGCLSWLTWSEPFRKAGLYLLVLTAIVHTLALMARMYISGRPPVTNLYSSAIFIGWGAVLTGALLDFIYRNGIGVAAAGFIGYATLVVAHYLGLGEDTIGTMQAVLDTNFWLATHVTTVTFGYTATFLAGAIAMVYIILAVFTPLMTPERSQATGKMIYGTICFAMLLSFVGTVLGGIWADQSWGRFWGWDPKENGALLIVLWNALILHARWGGMTKLRGMACLAVAGNIVTAWSWFGTNMLGVGLHAYGFIPGTVLWMGIFIASQLLIIGLGTLIPMEMWRSHQKPRPALGPGVPDISK